MIKRYKMIISVYLVLVMSLSFNGIYCYADEVSIPNPLNFQLTWSIEKLQPDESKTVQANYSSLNRNSSSRSIIIKDSNFIENLSNSLGYNETGQSIYCVILCKDYRSSNYSLTHTYSNLSGSGSSSPPNPELINTSFLYSQFSDYKNLGNYFGGYFIHSINNEVSPGGNYASLTSTAQWDTEEIPCVTSIENAYKYLFQNNNSVVENVETGDPPPIQDDTLPVPQSLTCDLHNRYTGSTPLIIGGWSNPANASFDAIKDTVKIHIQYKPSFQYYKRFIALKDEVVTARDWIDLGTFDNNNKNKWVNCFPNTPQTDTNVIKFETLQRDMQNVATYHNNDPRDATLANGTSWRVRYEMHDGRVSYWAVYNIKAIGTMKYSDDVTFQDNEDNVVSSDAVSYQNSEQTDPQNQDRDNSLLGRLKTALNNIQSLPKDMQTVADEGSSFANFLKKVWDKFPEIYILFIGGLIIAIILRILGR